jgi:hypothetical protein
MLTKRRLVAEVDDQLGGLGRVERLVQDSLADSHVGTSGANYIMEKSEAHS